MVYSEVDILTQEVATDVLFDLRGAGRSDDQYVMKAVFPGDVEDIYGNTPKALSFVPGFFTFTGAIAEHPSQGASGAALLGVVDPDRPDNLEAECEVTPIEMRDILAVIGLPMPLQSEKLQRAWPLTQAITATREALKSQPDGGVYPYGKIKELRALLAYVESIGGDTLILDQAPGSKLPLDG